MKAHMTPELRARIDKMEKAGLFGHGKPYEQSRYTADYMEAAWGEGYFPYVYQKHPGSRRTTRSAHGGMSWDLYREMWGSHGEFVVDGNLTSVEYADRLADHQGADADHRRRSRPGVALDCRGDARGDPRLEARDPSAVGTHDVRRSAGALREDRRGFRRESMIRKGRP